MKAKLIRAMLATLVATGVLQATNTAKSAGLVRVMFIAPEKFTDVSDGWSSPDHYRDHVLAEFKSQIEASARDYVTGGSQLEIKVTDIDLAGNIEPWRGPEFSHIRILRDIYPPRMELEFRLIGANGKVISEGKRRLMNPGYLMGSALPASDPLRFDKEIIRRWIRQEFGRPS
jgi:hypothetical protein